MSRRYKHPLRVLLAGLLAFSLLLSMPGVSSAASQSFTLTADTNMSIDVTCTGVWQVSTGGAWLLANTNCAGGPDTSPGMAQPGEVGNHYRIQIKDALGQVLDTQDGQLGDHPDDGFRQVHGSISGAAGTGAAEAAQLCIGFKGDFGGDTISGGYGYGCVDVDGNDEDPIGTCIYGTPSVTWNLRIENEGLITRAYLDFVIDADQSETAWGFTAFYRLGDDSASTYRKAPLSGYSRLQPLPADGTYTHELDGWVTDDPPGAMPHVYGVQVVAADGDGVLNIQPPYAPNDRLHPYNWDRPESEPDSRGGTTNTTGCWFYMGEQITEWEGMDGGEQTTGTPYEDTTPQAPALPDNYNPDDEPDEDDPWSWWRMLLAVLHDIWGAIKDLTGALRDLFKDLFIPSPGAWGFDGLLDQVKAKPPFSVGAGLADVAGGLGDSFQAAGDCGSLADFGTDDVPNAVVTCESVTAVPGYGGLYVLVQVGMVAFTGLGVWKLAQETMRER